MSTPETLFTPRLVPAFHGMIARSAAMEAVFERIERFAPTRIPVLVEGETGVGKEMVVEAIRRCAEAAGPYVAVNCAAIPRDLVESELFGHERGAFTGALRRHIGILSQADGGMLFLDEISDLPLAAQAKLLRAIETGEFRPVGGERLLRSTFRFVAASNENLGEAVARGRFRLDLLHRLGAARITVPPLRERREDIPPLAQAFLREFRALHHGSGPSHFAPGAMQLLVAADWPGNVRELRNVVAAAAAVCRTPALSVEDLEQVTEGVPHGGNGRTDLRTPTLAEAVRLAERGAIRDALTAADGNRDRAAALLGISVATLYRRLAADGDGAE